MGHGSTSRVYMERGCARRNQRLRLWLPTKHLLHTLTLPNPDAQSSHVRSVECLRTVISQPRTWELVNSA